MRLFLCTANLNIYTDWKTSKGDIKLSEESEENIRLSEQISQMMDEHDETIVMNQKLEYTLTQAKKKM